MKAWPLLLLPLAASLFGVWDVLRTERQAMELVEKTHVGLDGEEL